jgi:hypothetical protein
MSRARDTADQINRVNSSAADATALTIDSGERFGFGASPSSSSTVKIQNANDSTQNTLDLFNDNGNRNFSFQQDTAGNAKMKLEKNDGTDAIVFDTANGRCDIDNPANNSITLKTGGSERIRIDSDGLKFNGDTAAANALDDYEEGTWEPTLQGSSGNPTVTYNGDTGGSYTKIGRMVYLTGCVRWSSAPNGGSGTAMIGGLPFTNAPRTNGDNADGISSARAVLWNGTSSRTPTALGMKASNANLNLLATSSNSASITVQISDVGSNCMIQFSAVVYTS